MVVSSPREDQSAGRQSADRPYDEPSRSISATFPDETRQTPRPAFSVHAAGRKKFEASSIAAGARRQAKKDSR